MKMMMNIEKTLKSIHTLNELEQRVADNIWRNNPILALALLHHSETVKKPFERFFATSDFWAFVEKFRLTRLKVNGALITADEWVQEKFHPGSIKRAVQKIEPMDWS